MTQNNPFLLITCEHGGNSVPDQWQSCFASSNAQRHLNSHRGYDPGSLQAAQKLAGLLNAPLQYSTTSRLIVDLNRSLDSPQLFSKFIVDQHEQQRSQLLQKYYHPYRNRVIETIRQRIQSGNSVVHLSVHSFTPRFRGTERKFDIGVLFDPARDWEGALSNQLISHLSAGNATATRKFRVRGNQPYLGTDDGITTFLREMFSASQYAGIELEFNNRFAGLSDLTQDNWCRQIAVSMQMAIHQSA